MYDTRSTGPERNPETAAVDPEDPRSLIARWGSAVVAHGWTGVPSVLIRFARQLGLDAADLGILLALLDHWWRADEQAWPSLARIASHAGRSEKTVGGRIKRMASDGILEIHDRHHPSGQRASNGYTFQGLLRLLDVIAWNLDPKGYLTAKGAAELAKTHAGLRHPA